MEGIKLEIRVLNYFVEIAKQQSMTKASRSLHVSQPTLSRQIKELEDELGHTLFERSNYSLSLTPEGEILFERAMIILELTEQTLNEFSMMQAFNGGDIKIGCAESIGISLIAEVVKTLKKAYPRLKPHLYSGNYHLITEKLNYGTLDMAIVVQQVDTTNYYSLTLPHQDRWGLIVRKDDPLAQKEAISVEDLLQLPLITSRQGFSDEMPNTLKLPVIEQNIVATYDLLYNAAQFVKAGLGYAFSFDHLVDTSSESELCFRPLKPAIYSPMKLIWSKQHRLSKMAELFIDEMKRQYG